MTPKDKVSELMQEAYDLDKHNKTTQKRCKEISLMTVTQTLDIIRYHGTDIGSKYSLSFWLDVDRELNAL